MLASKDPVFVDFHGLEDLNAALLNCLDKNFCMLFESLKLSVTHYRTVLSLLLHLSIEEQRLYAWLRQTLIKTIATVVALNNWTKRTVILLDCCKATAGQAMRCSGGAVSMFVSFFHCSQMATTCYTCLMNTLDCVLIDDIIDCYNQWIELYLLAEVKSFSNKIQYVTDALHMDSMVFVCLSNLCFDTFHLLLFHYCSCAVHREDVFCL